MSIIAIALVLVTLAASKISRKWAIGLLLSGAAALGIFLGGSAAGATPASNALDATDQFTSEVGRDPAAAFANALGNANNIHAQIAADPQAAVADVHTFAAQPNAGALVIEAATPNPIAGTDAATTTTTTEPYNPERIITDRLPASLPDMVIQGLDPIVENAVGQDIVTPLPTPTDTPLPEQAARVRDLFISQVIDPDTSKCGDDYEVSRFQCSTGLVEKYQPAEMGPMPKVVMTARYGFWLESIDSQGRVCGAYLAAYQMCDGTVFVSSMAADNIVGHPATVGEQFALTAHERVHAWQEQQVLEATGDPEAFTNLAAHNHDAEVAAENHADGGAGTFYHAAVIGGDLTQHDFDAALIAFYNAGNNSGNSTDPHATGPQRQAFVRNGWQLDAIGQPLPPFEYEVVAA